MKKSKKGFLIASAIITLIVCVLTIILALGSAQIGSLITEDLITKALKQDSTYTFVEKGDGSYYFMYSDAEMGDVFIYESTIEKFVSFARILVLGIGIAVGVFALVKMILAIVIISKARKNEYAKGATIALFVLSILNVNILEAILLTVAMALSDKAEQPVFNNSSAIRPYNSEASKQQINAQTTRITSQPTAMATKPAIDKTKMPNLLVKCIIRKRIRK